jgi:hypothetical protein
MRLRQVALVARELKPVVGDLTAVFGLGAPFADPGVATFGLCNAVFPVGDTFLEVVAPTQDGTTAGRLLERRRGDGGYMVIVQTDDLAADRSRVESLGVRVAWAIDLEDAATIHLHPRDVGGAILSIDAMTPRESWRWGGPDWQRRSRTDVVTRIAAAEVQAADPDAMAARWAEVLAVPRAGRELLLEDSQIRFVPATDGRGDGVAGLDLEVRNRDHVSAAAARRGLALDEDVVRIGGVAVRLVAAGGATPRPADG